MVTALQAQIGLTQYLAKEIIPHIVPKKLNLLGGLIQLPVSDTDFNFLAGVMNSFSGADPDRVAGVLKMLGVATDGGQVDEEELFNTLKKAIEDNGGEAKIAGIIFKLEDVERMQEYVALEAQ